MSILLYGCTTWTLTKRMESWWLLHKNAASNIEQVLEATLHKTAAVRPLTTHTKTIQVWWTRHAGHCWRSKDELMSDALEWTPSHGRAKAGQPARIYIQQLCADRGCNLEDLAEAMDDRDAWRERVRKIRASNIMVMMMRTTFMNYFH